MNKASHKLVRAHAGFERWKKVLLIEIRQLYSMVSNYELNSEEWNTTEAINDCYIDLKDHMIIWLDTIFTGALALEDTLEEERKQGIITNSRIKELEEERNNLIEINKRLGDRLRSFINEEDF